MDAINQRRSIRRYKPDVPADADIRKLVEAAVCAPSACNLQVVEFVYVNDPEVMKRLQGCATGKLAWAPACIVVIYDSRFVRERHANIQSAAAAVQNMILKASELGLGTCWLAGFGGDAEVKKILSIPEHFEIACVVLVGYPDESPARPYRSSVEQVLHINRFIPKRPSLHLSTDPAHWRPEEVAEYRRRIFSVYNKRSELELLTDGQLEATWKRLVPHLKEIASGDGVIMDVNSWDLRYLERISTGLSVPASRLAAADCVEENLHIARSRLPGIRAVLIGEGYELDIEDDSLDCALLLNKIEFEPAPALLLAKLKGKLRAGGKLLLTVMLKGSSFERYLRARYLSVKIKDVYEDNPFYKIGPFTFMSERQIEQLLADSGYALLHRELFDLGLWEDELKLRRGRHPLVYGAVKVLAGMVPFKKEECMLCVAEKS